MGRGQTTKIAVLGDRPGDATQASAVRHASRLVRASAELRDGARRARAVDEILSSLCRGLVRFGGYRLAWVGAAEDDTTRSVRPLAWAGSTPDYVNGLKLTWADQERGRGPTGISLRERRTAVNPDVERNTAFAPWRESALAHGIRSSAAVCMTSPQWERLAVTVYSDRTGAFTEEELELVETLVAEAEPWLALLDANRRVESARRALELSAARRRALAKRLRADADETAFELHDTIAPLLFAGRMMSESLLSRVSDDARPAMSRVSSLFGDALDSVRSLSRRVRDGRTRSAAIGELLEELVAETSSLFAVPCTFSSSSSSAWCELDDPTRREVFLIVREALFNACKHARASRIDVACGCADEHRWITVVDDGIGFATHVVHEGLGLSSMAHRARAIGGSVELTSAPFAGTSVRLRLPR